MAVRIEAVTDLGLKRAQNEDSHGVWAPEDEALRARRGVLLVVADGMGGSRAGEVASRLAVETVLGVFRSAEEDDPAAVLRRAVAEANRVVYRESLAHPERQGMGTTCTAVAVRGAEAWFAHVGDSRAYLLRRRQAEQVTHDHSLVAQLVRDNQLTREEARSDPRRNVVTRSVGVGPEVEIDVEPFPQRLEPGDTLLVCSDGLHGVVTDEEILERASGDDLASCGRSLIELARERGGPDNITVVLARVEEPKRRARPAASAARARSTQTTLMLLILALVGLLLVLATIGWLALHATNASRSRNAAAPVSEAREIP
ncbi:MAG TPA: Stp1/IreP family PP2C-type Ser/Thr phosphatase [Terriglobales bacterium]|nr:Stp1/IreP family PP2C-type Ser/Thr phosphatase [Terriglobales bacterium]